MSDFKVSTAYLEEGDWISAKMDPREHLQTMAELKLHVGGSNPMRHENTQSEKIQESILVSTYPLALWLAHSWWRLNYEPLPAFSKKKPLSTDWRMSHEIGAVNQGYVWPRVLFVSDGEVMQIWAKRTGDDERQYIRYLNDINRYVIPLEDFQSSVNDFIEGVTERLDNRNLQGSDLAQLWEEVSDERKDSESERYRRLEAEMGYDPDECPEELVKNALSRKEKVGDATLSELAPVYGSSSEKNLIDVIEEADQAKSGIIGNISLKIPPKKPLDQNIEPWRQAASDARALRKDINNSDKPITDDSLGEFMGFKYSDFGDKWPCSIKADAAIAVVESHNRYRFIPRKGHPLARRFEMGRFIGDYLWTKRINGQGEGQWLASTDLKTSRQKYQRAFAAELLCPLPALQEYLDEDYSDDSIESAADYFKVSNKTVETLLLNNGLIPRSAFHDDNYAETFYPW